MGSVSLDSAVSHYLFPYFNPPGVCLVALDRKVDFQPLCPTVAILSGISGLPHSKMCFLPSGKHRLLLVITLK